MKIEEGLVLVLINIEQNKNNLSFVHYPIKDNVQGYNIKNKTI
mgnify:CR=1 FL=1